MRRKNPPPSGLVVIGQVKERTRRMVPFDNPTTEIVTYIVSSDNKRYYVDDFAPSSYYDVDSMVELSVYIKPYKKRNGDPSYTLCIQKDFHSAKGESF
jgi:hypothetical protein